MFLITGFLAGYLPGKYFAVADMVCWAIFSSACLVLISVTVCLKCSSLVLPAGLVSCLYLRLERSYFFGY
jgi:hypothetical protein